MHADARIDCSTYTIPCTVRYRLQFIVLSFYIYIATLAIASQLSIHPC